LPVIWGHFQRTTFQTISACIQRPHTRTKVIKKPKLQQNELSRISLQFKKGNRMVHTEQPAESYLCLRSRACPFRAAVANSTKLMPLLPAGKLRSLFTAKASSVFCMRPFGALK